MTDRRTILDLIEDDIYHHTTGAEDPLLLTDRLTGGQTVRVGNLAETVDGDDWLAVALELWAEAAA